MGNMEEADDPLREADDPPFRKDSKDHRKLITNRLMTEIMPSRFVIPRRRQMSRRGGHRDERALYPSIVFMHIIVST